MDVSQDEEHEESLGRARNKADTVSLTQRCLFAGSPVSTISSLPIKTSDLQVDKSFYAFQPRWSLHQRIRQPRIGRLFQPHRQMSKLSLCFLSFRSLFDTLSPPPCRVSTRRGLKLFLGTSFQGAFDQNFPATASVLWVLRWLAATQGARRQCALPRVTKRQLLQNPVPGARCLPSACSGAKCFVPSPRGTAGGYRPGPTQLTTEFSLVSKSQSSVLTKLCQPTAHFAKPKTCFDLLLTQHSREERLPKLSQED